MCGIVVGRPGALAQAQCRAWRKEVVRVWMRLTRQTRDGRRQAGNYYEGTRCSERQAAQDRVDTAMMS